MEFGFEPSATRFDQVRAISTWNLVADRFEAKFHYAILVANRSGAGRRPVTDLLARASELDDRPNSSSLQVCDHLGTCLRPG